MRMDMQRDSNLASLRDAVFFILFFRWWRSPSLAQPPAKFWHPSGMKRAQGRRALTCPQAPAKIWQASGVRHAAFVVALALGGGASANIAPAPLFRDNAVLQRDKPVAVWGRAEPGERVVVSFRSQEHETVADNLGRWRVTLDAMPACAEGASLVMRGNNTVTAANVLVGEVWLCSGQSNMEWMVKQSLNFGAESAAAKYPLIRHFWIPPVSSAFPRDEAQGAWAVCSPGTVGDFTAVGYFFGRELFKELKVPVGLVHSSWGGTMIEAWMSEEALRAEPAWPAISKRWRETAAAYPARLARYSSEMDAWTKEQAAAKRAGAPFTREKPREPDGAPGGRAQPAAIYNAMIAPLIPYGLRGVIWYQGEANATRYAEYRALFPAMIRQWRADFGQGDVPFYYAQLANYERGTEWAFQREAQQCALKLPATGQAVTIDIGESKSIHPKNKQEVGRRLALNALAKTHGRDVEYSGPEYAGVSREKGKEGNALRVSFTHAAGLRTRTGTRDAALPGFEIAGVDRKFRPAVARIEGETVVVSAPGVSEPVAVRYAWAPDPAVSLYNGAGLPAAPFRSDDWER